MKSQRLVWSSIVAVGIVATLSAQAPQATFEVASVKRRVGETPVGGASSGNRFHRPGATLVSVVQFAYDLPRFLVVGGPAWIDSDRWDIEAKAAAPVTTDEMRLMVRALLAERFGLKASLETRELPIYELVVARRDGQLGPDAKPAEIDCGPFLRGQRPSQESPLDQASGFPRCSFGGSWSGGVVTPRLNGVPMSRLAEYLRVPVGRVVVDRTGMTGNFDLQLTYLEDNPRLPPGAQIKEAPSLFTALQEQLGLKLESTRGPVDVLVIDSVQQPTEN